MTLPCSDLASALPILQQPFMPEALNVKCTATWPKGDPKNGLLVPFVDARTVAARLDHVAGAEWSTRFEFPSGDPNVALCYLTVLGTTRADVGKGGGFEVEKAAISDSLKRAAVQFGVSRYIYGLAAVTLTTSASENRPALKPKGSGKGRTLEVTPECVDWFRSTYARWLNSEKNRWGEPIDHHDEAGAVGDPAERLPVEATEPSQPELETEAKRAELEKRISDLNGGLPKGRGKGWLRALLKDASTAEEMAGVESKVKEYEDA